MTSRVACLDTGKGIWNQVRKLIHSESWDNVVLVTNSFGKEKFQESAEFIVVDDPQPVNAIALVIISMLKKRIRDTEVALNLISGLDNVHMALLSALIKLGFGIRMVESSNGKAAEV